MVCVCFLYRLIEREMYLHKHIPLFLCLAVVLASYFITFADGVHDNYSPDERKVAIAVQGTNNVLKEWVTVFKLMHEHLLDKVRLFLFTFDSDGIKFDGCDNTNIFCYSKSSTTWTQGRNYLIRKIYDYEQSKNAHFRYWLLADSDMLFFTCKHMPSKPENTEHEKAAFCLARFIQYHLLSAVSYAQVFFLGELGTESDVYHYDCGDAQFSAIHRAAVPILLPYVELLDKNSWWESQQIVWRIASGCIPMSGIGSGLLNGKQVKAEHAPYPKGAVRNLRAQVINKLFGSRGLSPNPIDNSTFDTVAGDCSNQENMKQNRANRPSGAIPVYINKRELAYTDAEVPINVTGSLSNTVETVATLHRLLPELPAYSSKDAEDSSKWRTTDEFHNCHAVLKERFDRFMKGVPIEEIDGVPLPKAGS